MVTINNIELLDEAGLVAYCGKDYITLYTKEEASGGFKKGDIIVSKASTRNPIICRYMGYDMWSMGSVVLTDAFFIYDAYKRPHPMTGVGEVEDFRLATKEEKELFNKKMKNAKEIDY